MPKKKKNFLYRHLEKNIKFYNQVMQVHHFKKASILGVFGVFVLAAFITSSVFFLKQSNENAYADTSSTSVSVQNSLPTTSSTSIDDGATNISLTENTTTAVSCTATITDNNGCSEIQDGVAILYRSDVTGGSGCTPDDNDCYSTTCSIDVGTCTGGGDLTVDYTCDFSVQYFADATDAGSVNAATDWTCEITPSDSTGSGTPDTDTIELATLTALDVTSSISYGSLTLGGDTGATNQSVTLTNTGNEPIDSEISGTDMTCTSGSVPVSGQKYDVADVTYASLSQTLSATPTTLEVDLAQRTGAEVNDLVYFGLAVPSAGASGSCTGSNTFTAVTD